MKAKLVSLITILVIMVLMTVTVLFEKIPGGLLGSTRVSSTLGGNITLYTVKAYKDKIGIFVGNNAEPDQVLDVYLDSLPKAEQSRLNAGIKINSQDDLIKLVEDYTS